MIKFDLKTLRKLSGSRSVSETFISGAFRINLESLVYPLGVPTGPKPDPRYGSKNLIARDLWVPQ